MSPFLLEMVIPRIFDPVKRFRWKTAQIGKKGPISGYLRCLAAFAQDVGATCQKTRAARFPAGAYMCQ
jgi:hypothetical protein